MAGVNGHPSGNYCKNCGLWQDAAKKAVDTGVYYIFVAGGGKASQLTHASNVCYLDLMACPNGCEKNVGPYSQMPCIIEKRENE